jgi:hypothetical protein
MNKIITFKTKNNGVGLLVPSTEREQTLTLEAIASQDLPPNTSWKIIDRRSLQAVDNIFLDALVWSEVKEFEISFDKAKEIWRNSFRRARKPILEKLDVEFIKALEAGDTQKQQEIVTKKQQLRDITEMPLPDSLEGIKNTWPDILL